MLINHEELTVELNEEEKQLVPIIIDRFKKKPGRENMVPNAMIIEGLNRNFGLKLTEPRIRKIIQYIRINNLLPGLIGVSKGYFYTDDPDEIQTWIDSMKQRENAMALSRKIAEDHLLAIKKGHHQQNQLNFIDLL